MAIRYNADEIFEMALQIERNGAKFYRRAAQNMEDEHAKATLLELAAMEDDHEKTFAAMRAELSEKERKEMVFDPDQELPLYLRALADRHVFDMKVDPSERLKDVKRFEDVLQTAIGLEKDSVVFYTGMKAMVPKHLGGARLDDIIAEEMGHMATLGDLIRCAKR